MSLSSGQKDFCPNFLREIALKSFPVKLALFRREQLQISHRSFPNSSDYQYIIPNYMINKLKCFNSE